MPQGLYKDLSGQIFSRLLVVRDSGKRSRVRNVLWECLCECGNIALVETHSLLIGRTRSCGCLQKEHVRNLNSRKAKENGLKGIQNRVLKPDALKHTVFDQYVINAKSRNFLFSLSFEQALILFLAPCYYCGVEKSNTIGRGIRAFQYNGIDRVDSSKGYEEGNIVPCCRDCNFAKGKKSRDDFLAWAKRVAEYSEKRNEFSRPS